MKLHSALQACALLLCVGACGSVETRPATMEGDVRAWVGRSYSDYVGAKGSPKMTIVSTDGGKTLEYVRERILHRQPSTNTIVTMATLPNGTAVPITNVSVEPGAVLTFTCKLVLRFSGKDLLESWNTEGNDC